MINKMPKMFKNKFINSSLKDTSIKLNLSFAILPLRNEEYSFLNYKLDVSLEDISVNSILNDSGYYLFLNLSYAQRYLLLIKSDYDFEIKNYLDIDESTFHNPSDNIEGKPVMDPAIRAYICEMVNFREKAENMDSENIPISLITTGILTYTSKKSIIRLVIKKAQIKNNGEIYNEKPLDDAEVYIKNTWDQTGQPIRPDNINSNIYEFLSIDEQVASGILGTLEKDIKNLGKKMFVKFGNTEFFDLVIKTQNIDIDEQFFSSELNSTNIINILILERIN